MFKFDILELSSDATIVTNGEKTLYNTDTNITASEWVKDKTKGKLKNVVPTKNGLNVHNGKSAKTTLREDSIGYFHNNANSVQYNMQYVGLYTTAFGSAHGLDVTKNNLFKVFGLFSARKLIKGDWLNARDEYIKPNTNHPEYRQFETDSLVYSLFNNASNQSSLRQVEYKNQLWDIKNEFFWISVDEMKDLADEYNYDELYQDAHANNNRYVHTLLFGEERIYDQLSDEAKAVLDYATQLTKDSIEMRKHMANDENHLNSWDAGYAQLKLVWKEFYPERFKEFRQLYKNLEEKMRPMVYELGFLKK